jgi:hypothetical protein
VFSPAQRKDNGPGFLNKSNQNHDISNPYHHFQCRDSTIRRSAVTIWKTHRQPFSTVPIPRTGGIPDHVGLFEVQKRQAVQLPYGVAELVNLLPTI